MRLCIDGRFRLHEVTGVERYATELTAALTRLVPADDLVIAAPRREAFGSGALGHLWEQRLPLSSAARRADVLVGLANWCPLIARRPRLIVLHDTLALTTPAAFSPVYRLAHQGFLTALRRDPHIMVTAASESAKPALDEYFQRDIAVIPCAVRPPAVSALAGYASAARQLLGFDERFVLHVGAHDPRKNAAFVRQLAPALAEHGIRTVQTARRGKRSFTGVELDSSAAVTVLWDVSDDVLWGLYAEADALLQPSSAEGFGLPLLEAAAVGTPFVSTDVGAARSLALDDAQVQPLYGDLWVDAVRHLHAKRHELKPKLEQLASGRTWDDSAARLLELCEQLAP